MVFDATTPPLEHEPTNSRRRRPRTTQVMSALLSSRVVHVSSVTVPTQWFPQESVVLAFQKLFPAAWFDGFKFPLVEDLLNSSPFVEFQEWRAEVWGSWEGPFNPVLAPPSVRLVQRHAEGQQAGALSHRAALPPLVPFGLDPDQHFASACERASFPLPTEQAPLLDADLHFAAWCAARWRGHLRTKRQQAMGALRELKSRWAGVGKILSQHQSEAIHRATSTRDIGLMSLLLLISSWGDVTYPLGLVQGLPAVGFAPCYNIFPQQPATTLGMGDVLEGWEVHNQSILDSLHPGKDDAFLLSQSVSDAEQGFCSFPMARGDFLKTIKNQPHRLIPRCVITQSSGKQRIIDNADVGGQSSKSSDANKLVLCTPLRVAQHISATHSWMSSDDIRAAQVGDSWETGGEDWPNAYRHSPMSRSESMGCVVVFWHHEWECPAYQLYTGLLFGLPLAVTSFNRYSRLVETLGRRFCYVLTSLYFDDACITDWASSRGSGQFAFQQLNHLLGTPFASEKMQKMASKGTFLGLDHDLSGCLTNGVVVFWARERIQSKLADLIQFCRNTQSLPPGIASKIYGIANFFEQGVWGRVGAGGLAAIKERQYSRGTTLTDSIRSCFEVLEAIMSVRPQRTVDVLPASCQRFCVASDAALEIPQQGSGGFLIVWLDAPERREAFVANIPAAIYSLWTPGDRKIAQLELMMVLYGLLSRPADFRNRRGIWFIDNVAALICVSFGVGQTTLI